MPIYFSLWLLWICEIVVDRRTEFQVSTACPPPPPPSMTKVQEKKAAIYCTCSMGQEGYCSTVTSWQGTHHPPA